MFIDARHHGHIFQGDIGLAVIIQFDVSKAKVLFYVFDSGKIQNPLGLEPDLFAPLPTEIQAVIATKWRSRGFGLPSSLSSHAASGVVTII